jgi:hypothetical protein
MADLRTNLLDLPVEVRMQIYGYLLIEEEPVDIDIIHRHNKTAELVRYDYKDRRDGRHRFQLWSRAKRSWIAAPPINTAIIFVNHQIHAEGIQTLYGNNCFSFVGSTALKKALGMLGSHAQYLRYIKLSGGGYARSTIRSALNSLAVAQGLRRIEIDYIEMFNGTLMPSQIAGDFHKLLRALQKSYINDKLSASVLDVVKLGAFSGGNHFWRRCARCTRLRISNPLFARDCPCGVETFRANLAAHEAAIRSAIAKVLDLVE